MTRHALHPRQLLRPRPPRQTRRGAVAAALAVLAALGLVAGTMPSHAASAVVGPPPLPDPVAAVTPSTLYQDGQATVTAYPVTPSGPVSVRVLDDGDVVATSSATAEPDRYAVFHLSNEEGVLAPGSYEVEITDETTGEMVGAGFEVGADDANDASNLVAERQRVPVGEPVTLTRGRSLPFSGLPHRVAVRPAGLIGPVTLIPGAQRGNGGYIAADSVDLPPGRYYGTQMDLDGVFAPDSAGVFEVVDLDEQVASGAHSAPSTEERPRAAAGSGPAQAPKAADRPHPESGPADVPPATVSPISSTRADDGPGAATTDPVPWGLDFLDGGLDGVYDPAHTGTGVTAYVLDTGIRTSHAQFAGRATHGYDLVDDDADASDCHGRGTHLAGVVGGETSGVATDVDIVGVRVMGCDGTGDVVDTIDGIRWVIDNHPATRPGVMLVTWYGEFSRALNESVAAAEDAGIDVVMPAGDEGRDGCDRRLGVKWQALVVAATDQNDDLLPTSNTGIMRPLIEQNGECLGASAPGLDIPSASHTSDTATATRSGTAVAAAHATGAAALYLQQGTFIGSDPTALCHRAQPMDCYRSIQVVSVTDGELILELAETGDGIDVAPGTTESVPVRIHANVARTDAHVTVTSDRPDVQAHFTFGADLNALHLYYDSVRSIHVTADADAQASPPPQVTLHVEYDGETFDLPLDVRVAPTS